MPDDLREFSGLTLTMVDDINSKLHIHVSGAYRGRRVDFAIPLDVVYSPKKLTKVLLAHIGRNFMPFRDYLLSRMPELEVQPIYYDPLLRLKMGYLVNQILAIPTMESFADFHRAKIFYRRQVGDDGKEYGDDMVYIEVKLLQNKLRSGTVEISTSELAKLLARLPIEILTIGINGVAYSAIRVSPETLKMWKERGMKMELPPLKEPDASDIEKELQLEYKQEEDNLL